MDIFFFFVKNPATFLALNLKFSKFLTTVYYESPHTVHIY
jgi:hypothetical protein